MEKFKRIYTAFLQLIVCVFVTGCVQSQSTPKQQLRINLHCDPPTLDPRKGGDMASVATDFLLFEGLTRLTPDGPTEPGVAYSIDLSLDKLTYTFYLRKAYWSDGNMLEAEDFVYAWKSMLDPKFPSLAAHLLYPIKNAREIKQGKLSPDCLKVVAKDAQTLIVQLERPTPYFLELTAFAALHPVPRRYAEKNKHWAEGQSVVSNGPFYLASRKRKDNLKLKKNPYYWEKQKVHINEMQISVIEDENTALRLFERKELDLLGSPFTTVPADAIPTLDAKNMVHRYPIIATTACAFNLQHPFLSNKNIRKAISQAIDRAEIVTNITQLGEIPASQIVHPALATWGENAHIIEEPAKVLFAKGLKELGIEKSALPSLKILFSLNDRNQKIAQAVQQQLINHLSLAVELEASETKICLDRLAKHQFDLGLFVMRAYYHDPLSILERFQYLDSSKNYPAWNHDQYIKLLEDQAYAKDKSERDNILQSAERIVMEELPITPIFHWKFAFMQQPYVRGVYISPRGSINPQWASIVARPSGQ